MPFYAWRNQKTGEEVELLRPMAEATVPPDDSGDWERIYSFGVGRVEGAGSSPPRTSVKRDS